VLGLEPAWPGASAVGRALTVRGAAGDNLAIHQAVAEGERGEVIVVTVDGGQEIAHCGDVLALAAKERGIAGIIIDGSIRDRAAVARLGFPIFHRGTSPRGPGKYGPGELRVPIELLGVPIQPGDLVCADDDGVVVVPSAEVEAVLADARALEAREQELMAQILDGASTLDLFSLPKRSR
jgi:4-hydroxy-4-methyl-2-oxoglutarate aldolase